MKKRWFDKLIGCSFYLFDDMTGGKSGEYIFCGTCENSDHDNKRDPLQYEFYADGKPQILLTYKEAHRVMGVMADFYEKENNYDRNK